MFADQSHHSTNLRLAVRYRPIEELTPDAANPRAHKPSQIKQLAKSMRTFGVVNPVLIDAQSRIVAGHARVLAAQSLGLSEVPTILLEHPFTTRNGLVLDPFLGSGSSIVAAERTGRRCYGLEIEPLYVDTAIRRWQAHTGEVARHAKSGGSFADIAAERQTSLFAGEPIHG
jgi:hypothetical protein